jgi:bifunctional non-homologous end joining protein LigD
MVFDLLALEGADLRQSRLIDRKDKLEALLKNSPVNIRFSSHARGDGENIFGAACRANLEGIIGKKADSLYSGTRNGDWIKVKCGNEQEFVIGGYTQTEKKTSGISAILLGVYEGNDLVYAGRAGTGFTARTMKELEGKFKSIISAESAFKDVPKPRKNETAIWLKPMLVAQIKFAEWTKDNVLRQASYKGLRNDKNPKEVKRENDQADPETLIKPKEKEADRMSVTVNSVTISSPDKAMYEEPLITKKDVAEYYSQAAERMLPYMGNRILSVIRCPNGISGERFFKKHPRPGAKGIIKMPIKENDGEIKDYFYIDNAYGLISEVQMNTVEFHTWGSPVSQLELPDTMVFDLDPGEGLSIDRVREGVRDLKKVLDELSLVSYLKTSGGKGYHIVIPLKPSAGWDAFSGFAKRVAEAMQQRWPNRYTSNMRKEHREGKIFIDWVRNSRGSTSIAPYSLRARKGAPVSMPITWQQLDAIAPDEINLSKAAEMIGQEDPWMDYFNIKQRIKGEKLS